MVGNDSLGKLRARGAAGKHAMSATEAFARREVSLITLECRNCDVSHGLSVNIRFWPMDAIVAEARNALDADYPAVVAQLVATPLVARSANTEKARSAIRISPLP